MSPALRGQAARIPGATERQVGLWVAAGYLRPACRGRGSARRWSMQELAVAETMALLVKVGLRPEAAARAARSGGALSDRVRVVVMGPPPGAGRARAGDGP